MSGRRVVYLTDAQIALLMGLIPQRRAELVAAGLESCARDMDGIYQELIAGLNESSVEVGK